MVKIKHLPALCLAAAATAILFTASCQDESRPEASMSSRMEIRDTARLEVAQTAAGARDDATMYPQHFDGSDLTSLGTDKLDLMLADSHSCNPLLVYLAVPNDQYAQARRLTIGQYLEKEYGLKPAQIEFRDGPEPSSYAPSAPNLKNYDKTDTAADNASAGAGASGSGASGSTNH